MNDNKKTQEVNESMIRGRGWRVAAIHQISIFEIHVNAPAWWDAEDYFAACGTALP